MTDILTKLAALTQSGSNDLIPCPFCGNPSEIQFWEEDEGNTNGYYPQCSYCCAEIEGLYTTDAAISAWNGRPREAAFIALVQEAAGEIERLRKLIPIAYRRGWDKAAYGGLCGDAWKSEDDLKKAVKPQEAA